MILGHWLRAFIATCALELPVVLLLTRDIGVPPARRLFVAFLGQLATHPLVWFIFPVVPGLTGWGAFVASEAVAWFVEAGLYWAVWSALGFRRAFGIAGVANSVSILAGLLIL